MKHQPRHYLAFATLRLEGSLLLPDQTEALLIFGEGFIQHAANEALRQALDILVCPARRFHLVAPP